jgi:putative SOS response-associated peptidase YedK
MCYSAQIRSSYKDFVRHWGATISIKDFVRIYWLRSEGHKIKIPKAVDALFSEPHTQDERAIREMIAQFNLQESTRFEQELFKQRKRLADAERTLASKATKAAVDSKRIAADKIAWCLEKLASIRTPSLVAEDFRIYPGWFAPVLVSDGEQRQIRPMRYHCRIAGAAPSFDKQYPGCFNARRDSLDGLWRKQFGTSHAVLILDAFFENVSKHRVEKRELLPGEKEQGVVLEFRPRPALEMLAACIWSHWTGSGEPELNSFAAITDEPPPEVAAAGHDRCLIPLKAENLDAWLKPDGVGLTQMYRILDDRVRPYYEHRLAA